MFDRRLILILLVLALTFSLSMVMGQNREEVREIQSSLKEKGYDPGPIDGVMGPMTQCTLRVFQRSNDLQATGRIDEQTRSALGIGEMRDQMGTEPGRADTATEPGRADDPDTDLDTQPETQPDWETQPGMTQEQQDHDRQQQEAEHRDETELARQAAEVLKEMTQESPDHDIPRWLMERARAIAVIPNVTQAALGVGGRWGDGLITARGQGGAWSAPTYISMGGASVGLQAGVERSDVILIFTDDQALNRIVDGRFELGADVQVAAGPVGREAAAGVDADLDPVYTYSRSRGLFAGASLEGAVISFDEEANQRVYGQNVTARDLLISRTVQATAAVQPFLNAVQQHVQPMRAE